MGQVRNVSSDLPRKVAGSGVRAARLSKKDSSDQPARRRISSHKAEGTVERSSALKKGAKVEKAESVWEALGFDPVQSANLNARALLMFQLENLLEKKGWTQAEAAKRCGVSQPRLNDLLRGRVSKFSLDALVNIGVALGCKVQVSLRKA